MRYMGWVKVHLAEPDEEIRGAPGPSGASPFRPRFAVSRTQK